MTSVQPFKVAVIQHAPVFLNLEQSVHKAKTLIEDAANNGAKVIVFPETWLPGYPIWLDYAPKAALWDYPPAKALYRLLAENAVAVGDNHFKTLQQIAGETGTVIVMGAHERFEGTLYNTIFTFDQDGTTFVLHRKLVPTYTERLLWGRGDGSTLSVLDTPYGIIGSLICWEHWMPLARAAMHAKMEVLHVAQWPAVRDLHQVASRHYAFEGQCFVMAAGCVLSRGQIINGFHSLNRPDNPAIDLLETMPGEKDTLFLNGGSCIILPDSEYLAQPLFDKEGIIYGDIDPRLITEGHLTLDTNGHYSRPDVFRLEINDQPQVNTVWKSDTE